MTREQKSFDRESAALIKSRPLFLLLLQIKALDWKATVGVGCNPLIASLDAFYARWKCTTGGAAPGSQESASLVQCTHISPSSPCTTVSSRPRWPSKAQPPPISMTHCTTDGQPMAWCTQAYLDGCTALPELLLWCTLYPLLLVSTPHFCTDLVPGEFHSVEWCTWSPGISTWCIYRCA